MKLAAPLFLVLLVLLPVLWRWRRRGQAAEAALRYSDLSATSGLRPSLRVRGRGLLFPLRLLAIGLLVLGLARPRTDLGAETVTAEGIDIMLALDASGSMRTVDYGGDDRFHIVKRVVQRFVEGISSDRVGLVVFGAQAFTQCPLTLDYRVLLDLLDQIEVGSVDETRTAIGSALATAAGRLEESRSESKVVILLTDGENNAGKIDPVTAARGAAALDVKVYTIGVGKEGWGYAPVQGPSGNVAMKQVQTHIDEDTLREVARIAGGEYFRAEDEDTLQQVYDRIWKLERTKFEARAYRRYRELFPPLVWLALGLLALEALLVNTWLLKTP
ncbi:MAG: VWA domain-containing protein [Armatimonadota bacterium]